MKKLKTLFLIIQLLIPSLCLAQIKISGKVNDKASSISYANVILKNLADSTLTGGVTDENGNYNLSVPQGRYRLTVTYLNYQTFNREINLTSNLIFNVLLAQSNKMLEEVSVVGQKERITRKIDRLVYNIENSPTATGGNANDVLKVAPGLVLINDQISMLGRSAVKVMIDGRLVELSGQELKNFLNSISANDIKEIEIISNPPAKYDAEGNSGMVNIVFKKGRKNSWKDNFSVSHTQAKYGKESINNSFTYQKDKVNVAINLGTDFGQNFIEQRANMFFTNTPHSLNSKIKENIANYSARLLIDYQLSNSTKLGIQYLGNRNTDKFDDQINTLVFNNRNTLDSILSGKGHTDVKNYNNSLNAHLEQRLDTSGKKMYIDVDYLNYDTRKNSTIVSNTFDPAGQFLGLNFSNLGNAVQNINNYDAKIDFDHPLKFVNLSYGGKVSFTKTNYTLNNYNTASGIAILNPTQSDDFQFKENIQSVYLNALKKFGAKWETQLGVRAEFTQTDQAVLKNNYAKIFPTFYLKYLSNENNQYIFSYGRRIERPNYAQLNPARYFISSQVSSMGNPYLTPSFNDNIELTHIFKNKLTSKFSINITSNAYNTVPLLVDSLQQQIVTVENFYKTYNYSLQETYQLNLTSWLRNDITLFLNNSQSKNTNDRVIATLHNGFEFYGSLNNLITFNKSILGEINYGYGSPYNSNLNQYSRYSDLDMAITFKGLFKLFNLTTGVNDVFNTSSRKQTSEVNGIRQDYISFPSNRYIRFTLVYNFGNNKLSANERDFGNESERNRSN